MKVHFAAAFLVALGCLQMVGDLTGMTAIKGIGAASQASPAPKVFTAQSGFETFSSRFYIDWQDRQGSLHTLELTPQVYRGIQGPYNRRNAYGAALAYGPVLASDESTRPMFEQVARYSFCGKAPVLGELHIPRDQVTYPVRVRLEPREERSRCPQWQREVWIDCE